MGDPGIKWVTGVRCAYEESNRILRSGHEKSRSLAAIFYEHRNNSISDLPNHTDTLTFLFEFQSQP